MNSIASNNTALFLCLCKDLGYSPRSQTFMSEAILDGLRKKLMLVSENQFNESDVSQWTREFATHFSAERPLMLSAPDCFRDLYQLLSFRLKIKKTHTHDQEIEYLRRFKATEEETSRYHVNRSNPVSRLARYLLRTTCPGLDLSCENIARFARHGPGAVSDGSLYDDKSWWDAMPKPMLSVFPKDWFFANPNFSSDYCTESYRKISPNVDNKLKSEHYLNDDASRHPNYVTARLALVPKDWKGPRGVFVSPKEAVFCQIGIDGAVKEFMKNSWFRYCYDPNSQEPSQEVSYVGSFTRQWSTLDLSDASDRIPLRLVSYLFHRKDYLALSCTRPSHVILPDGSHMRLSMSSPMGDGKTFAVLTLVCAVLVLASILVADGYLAARPPKADVIERYAKKIRVFGDDIAVHSEYFKQVCIDLESHNLKVNVSKSFTNGHFRESCGMDAFNGVDITPARQRCDLDGDANLEELLAFHNRVVLRYSRLVSVSNYLVTYITSKFRGVAFSSNTERYPLTLQVPKSLVFYYNHRAENRMKFDLVGCRLLVRSYTGKRELTYPDAYDDRYRLNYSLFPRNGNVIPGPYLGSRWPGKGSPRMLAYANRLFSSMGIGICLEPRPCFRRGWVEM